MKRQSRHTSGINTGPMEMPDDELEQLYGKAAMDSYNKLERRCIAAFYLFAVGIIVLALLQ